MKLKKFPRWCVNDRVLAVPSSLCLSLPLQPVSTPASTPDKKNKKKKKKAKKEVAAED